MRKCDVRSIKQAFDYIADCNLATVSRMSGLKSRNKGEFKRQIAIAQSMIDWIYQFGIDSIARDTRVRDIVFKFNGKVELWADQYDVLKKRGET